MAEALKNNYNQRYISNLANALADTHPAFNQKKFSKLVLNSEWRNMELKQRLHHITCSIHDTLNLPYPQAIAVLTKACRQFGGYEGMFFPDYVEQYGLENWKTSMHALELFTQVSSSEFAVRPFILKNTEKMMRQMLIWSKHKNHHVRRLASEGCRPRLPWAMALPAFKQNPSLIFPILDNLKQDSSIYVRKSVANNLNDISKDNPVLVIRWCKKNIGNNPHTDWIIKRACRSMLKAGNAEALKLFSYTPPKKTRLTEFTLDKKKLRIGETLSFSCTIVKPPKNALRIEYAIHFAKKNGALSVKKFHVMDATNNGDNLSFAKKHSFQQRTTRIHYSGKHWLELFVNGVAIGKRDFLLF